MARKILLLWFILFWACGWGGNSPYYNWTTMLQRNGPYYNSTADLSQLVATDRKTGPYCNQEKASFEIRKFSRQPRPFNVFGGGLSSWSALQSS